MTRRGLGSGLDALLSSTEPEPADAAGADAPDGGAARIPIDAVRPNPYQPRRAFEPEALEELAASIRSHGLIQPLVVTPGADDEGGYVLIAGERRWRAAQAAGLPEVPVIVRDATPREMLALAIVENVQRTDLDPIDAATAYRRLLDEFDLTQAQVAELVGKSRVAIANTVRLLNLAAAVQRLVADGHLSAGHARALLGLEDAAGQAGLAKRAIDNGWTVRRTEAEVRRANEAEGVDAPPRAAGAETDPDTAAAVRALEDALGAPVAIRRRGEGGSLVIKFFSEEELTALHARILGGT